MNISRTLPSIAALAALCAPALSDDQFPPMPPVKAHTPAETIASVQLPPGYHLQLVLSEPDIKEPVIASFDGDGRMFVAEMRSYMQEIDGKNELDPVSRVSLHWSSKGDGVCDKHTVFADKKEPFYIGGASPGLKGIAAAVLHPAQAIAAQQFTADQLKQLKAGEVIYTTLCTACHGPDGKGMPMVGAAPGARLGPALAGSKTLLGHKSGPIYVQLHGLIGDIDGRKNEGQMIAMATNDDAWIAAVLSFVRNSFGNHASFIAPPEVARIRAATKDRTQPWTITELQVFAPGAAVKVAGN